MNELALEFLGGFAGVLTSMLVLALLGFCLIARRPMAIRAFAASLGAVVAAVEADGPSTAVVAAAIGGTLGMLILAEAWLSVVLPGVRLLWRIAEVGTAIAGDVARLARRRLDPPPRDPD
jgi:hypothetical protein